MSATTDTHARDVRIGPTAHYTAYAWHRLRLPHAEHFVTPRGRALYWAMRGAGEWAVKARRGMPYQVDVLAYRHRLIEREALARTPERVIELGAGLSRRGLTFAADHQIDFVEVDLPHMIAAKRARLDALPAALRERAGGRLRLETRDLLAPGLDAWLAEQLRGAARPVIIAEGVLGYFPRDERARIASAVARALAGTGGVFLCDLRDGELSLPMAGAMRAFRGLVRLVTRGRGLREDFASAEVARAFFRDAGFESAEPVEPAPPELAHLTIPIRVWRCR